jgi:hypothetical protein
VKKAAKTTRAAKRGKDCQPLPRLAKKPLPPRAEWDFSKVTRRASAVVCMREYAKECLRRLRSDQKFCDFADELGAKFAKSANMTAVDLCSAVVAGLTVRANVKDGTTHAPIEPMRAVDPREATISPGSQVAFFAIDWRGTNAEIRRAFNDWLTKQSKGHPQPWPWEGDFEGTLSSILSYERGGIPHDYVDAAEAALTVTQHKANRPLAPTLIAAQRRMRGDSKGRGDARHALLTDLAIYRIHAAGCSGQAMADALGNSRLKFYDTPLVTRALKSADRRQWDTLADAFTCESLAAVLKAFCLKHKVRGDFLHPAFRQT